jgi:hypothetical protein
MVKVQGQVHLGQASTLKSKTSSFGRVHEYMHALRHTINEILCFYLYESCVMVLSGLLSAGELVVRHT